ncbi:MAG: CbtA family protein [Rhizomicrobium sp.]
MVGALLLRGMLVGLFAGLLAFGFAKAFGEPQVDVAIGFESHMAQTRGEAPEPVLITREVQSTWGLFAGVIVFGTALGGLFALVFAFLLGRMGAFGPRTLAALLALAAFLALVVFPDLKYPANPPAIGNPDTIGHRTALYFGFLVISIAATSFSVFVARKLSRTLGAWNGGIAGGAVLVAALALAMILLPDVNEVPTGFPAATLWRFRVAALGLQAVIWLSIGLGFGWLTEQQAGRRIGRL